MYSINLLITLPHITKYDYTLKTLLSQKNTFTPFKQDTSGEYLVTTEESCHKVSNQAIRNTTEILKNKVCVIITLHLTLPTSKEIHLINSLLASSLFIALENIQQASKDDV